MRVFKITTTANEIIKETTIISSRDLGSKLAEMVHPGDTIDFENKNDLFSHSIVDEFLRRFIELHGKEKLNTLKFINLTTPMENLMRRAIKIRTQSLKKTILHSETLLKGVKKVASEDIWKGL